MINKKYILANVFRRIIYKNNSGVAIIMILSAITLLTYVIYDFAFEVRLNSARIIGQQTSLQARLNAEAGLRLAICKLRLYKEGHNMIENDKKIKDLVPPNLLQEVITMPFVYPIPLGADANLIQKSALADFEKESLIQGEMNVEIIPVSGFLNPNNMRIKTTKDPKNPDNNLVQEDENDSSFKVHSFIEKEILKVIEDTFEKKKEEDEAFESLYDDVEPKLLVKELKYFVTDKGKFVDEEKADIEQIYMEKNITPKFAPLTSLSELNLLEGWNDDFVNLLKDKLSVHEVSIIAINKLTESQLKLLFPEITEEQSKEFFKYRDGDPNANPDDTESDDSPHPFDSEADFKELIVTKLAIIDDTKYDERSNELKKAGLKFGVAGKLFKVISTGRLDKASYTIKAYVDLPIKPIPTPTQTPGAGPQINSNDPSKVPPPTPTPTPTPVPEEFLNPRVIEIYYND